MASQPSKDLLTFENPHPNREYEIVFDIPEFTCICPITGQPDFAQFVIRYVPNKLCVELKSLKLYMWSFRDEGAFHEDVTNKICNDIIKTVSPKWIKIEGRFNNRGGIHTSVIIEEGKRGL